MLNCVNANRSESHSLMLQQIDEVIASTPLPKSRKTPKSNGLDADATPMRPTSVARSAFKVGTKCIYYLTIT